MGILERIFKSLGFGKEEEQAGAPKRTETVGSPLGTLGQSYRPSPESQSRREPAKTAQRPVEMSARAPQTQPAPLPPPMKPPEPVQPRKPEFVQPAPAAYQHQAVEEEIYDNIPFEESTPPEDLASARGISMNDLAETIQSTTPPPLPGSQAVEANLFEEVVDDFDEAFDAAFNVVAVPSQQSAAAGEVAHDEAAIQDLFANIAANYARPVKNFVFELKRGTATKEWIEICRPAMRSISRAAESMDLALAAKRMNDFDEALSLAQTSEERILGGEIRDIILASYDDLIEVLPQTFIIGEEEQQREGIIINSLLKQIPDLGRVTFEKLYGAGLTSLDTLFLAKKEDLAAATGIPLWLCERICNKFKQYREELEGTPRDVAQSGYRSRLGELVAELRRQHEGFERASAEEWSNPALAIEKRRFRQNRQACVLQINVVLAEMGELDLVNEIQKLSFERRIQRLEEYLASSPGM